MALPHKVTHVCKEPSIDASYQVSVHLAEGFQRRRLKCEKLTDDRRREPSDGKSSRFLWQGELKSPRIAHFVPTLLQTWPPQAILVSD
jgi:hypothetical protein